MHAGDVGTIDVLARLQALAPVTAVLGNTDLPFWGDDLPWEIEAEALGLRILVCHIGKSLMGRHDPVAEGFDLVVSGHSHKAAVEWREDTLFLNPGAAGKARFGGPRTLALVTVGAGRPAGAGDRPAGLSARPLARRAGRLGDARAPPPSAARTAS